MNTLTESTREYLSIALYFVAVIMAAFSNRRRMRPWHFAASGLTALVTIPLTLWFMQGARAGEYSGWGGLALVLYALPAVFLAAGSVTLLLTMTVLLPFYGFDTRTREQRRAERQFRRSAAGRRLEAKRDFKLTLVVLAVVLVLFKLGRLPN